ncbi:YetF domain-containing protein [Fulvimarina sp. MAC8]|uniref:DUF421 domain-containing protein n=1 Tax=Fulvimarina sp. MAC8 TaxID=3162874 RepID=UPI0032F06C12
MFFDSWFGTLRVIVVAPLAYAALIALIRLSGKRSLAKLNAFDMIVTVALGSTLASVVLSSSVALAEGILAFAVLLGLQFVVAWSSVRSERFERLVKAEPTLLFFDGQFLERVMRRERIARDEILALLRAEGGERA